MNRRIVFRVKRDVGPGERIHTEKCPYVILGEFKSYEEAEKYIGLYKINSILSIEKVHIISNPTDDED